MRLKSIILFSIFIIACSGSSSSDNLIGTWRGIEDGKFIYLIFKRNGDLEMLDHNRKPISEDDENISTKYEAITEIEPHQLYIIMSTAENYQRTPFGIYKIEGNKLIIRQPIEYHRTLGGFDLGVSRYETPKDFNGVVEVFEKL